MPTKTWEPPPRQSDTGTSPRRVETVEPRNFEPGDTDPARNPDAAHDGEPGRMEHADINMHGSER